jgi:hypothetical protein
MGLLLGAAVAASFRGPSDQPAGGATPPPSINAIEGWVGSIDRGTRSFVLHTADGDRITVAVAPGAPLTVRLRFRHLRADDFVRIETEPAGQGRVGIDRFVAVRRGGADVAVDALPAEPSLRTLRSRL